MAFSPCCCVEPPAHEGTADRILPRTIDARTLQDNLSAGKENQGLKEPAPATGTRLMAVAINKVATRSQPAHRLSSWPFNWLP